MKTARIPRPTPQRPSVASRAETLNEWLVRFHGFDLSRPYSCAEVRTVNADGSFSIELVYEQDDAEPTHEEHAVTANAPLRREDAALERRKLQEAKR